MMRLDKKVPEKIDKRVKIEKERQKVLRKVYATIADDVPYIFLFNSKYILFAHSSRVKWQKPTYQYGIGLSTWWITK